MSDPESALLKVGPDAPLADLKKAYRKAALALHPDQNPDPAAARHFRRLTEAYRTLEARALVREPARPPRDIPLADRFSFLLGDLRSLVRRWPADRWAQTADGLPAAVWAVSSLEVVGRLWPGAPAFPSVSPTVQGLAEALDRWEDLRRTCPLPHPVPRPLARDLSGALRAAESRIRALEKGTPRRD